MQATIGHQLIKQIKPAQKPYDIRDQKLKGFLIRVNPSGSMKYVCQYQRGQRITIASVGVITPAQARERSLAILGDVAKGIDPKTPKVSQDLNLQ